MGAKRVTCTYDTVGNRAVLLDPDAGRTTYAYDEVNRLTSLLNPLAERTTWVYDAVGRIATLTYATGAYTTQTYDAVGRVTRLAHRKSDATVVETFEYAYDAVGNPTVLAEANGDRVTWTYDALNQLIGDVRGGANDYAHTYTYDAVGNRVTRVDLMSAGTYTYDAANQLQTIAHASDLTTYSYDANGNTILKDTGDALTTLTWGYEDELLTTILQPSGMPVTMTYDGDLKRRKRAQANWWNTYVWDGQQVLTVLDQADDTQARYTLAPFGYGDLVSQRRGDDSHFFHFDAIGTTRALTDASQDVTDSYLHRAFGTYVNAVGDTLNYFRYIGQLGYYQDYAVPDGGFYLRRRYYAAGLGRFLSRDPVYEAGVSAYRYVRNRATRGTDPGGLQYPAPRPVPVPDLRPAVMQREVAYKPTWSPD
ncbi:MAG: hypothetical protein FJX75_06535 [Armatimonadetes bacterium]|nr:hypothetical protein [Armatimonadota bacterium]